MRPQVLFVSKPVVAPFNDGSKCLVRDIAGAMTAVVPRVMVTQGGESGLPGVAVARTYGKSTGHYRPALVDNARVFLWLLTRSRESLWHFVFAPNPRTCQMGRLLKGIRGIPVVQTVASPPRTFQDPHRLLFGDVVVTQSHWTKDEFLRAYRERGTREPPRIEVIPPAVPHIERPTPQRISDVRGQLEIPENAPLLLYPGDLEVSRASHWVAGIVEPLLRAAPEVRVVFAYREKTPRAAECAKALQAKLPLASVRFVSEVPDMHALLATTQVVLFPVDDLYGKVDLPIVILEAMHLGVPVVALDRGPLADLEGVLRVAPGDEGAILDKALRVLRDDSFRQACVEAQRDAIERQHRPAQVARRYEAIYQNLLARLPD